MTTQALTAERVRDLLDYNPETGDLIWIYPQSVRVSLGDIAGARHRGGQAKSDRFNIGIDGVRYLAHRVIWLWMTGKWPEHEIDHKDQDGANNRWNNLREATKFQNAKNISLTKRNSSGVKGAYFETRSGRYVAEIRVDNKKIWLGKYDTAEEAGRAYRAGVAKYHGEFGCPT